MKWRSICIKILQKINPKLKFLYGKCRYLTSAFRRLLSNALIQQHFGKGCSSWFPLLKENLKVKLKKAQNKYICFCLNLPPRSCINPCHFRKTKIKKKILCANIVSKYYNGTVPEYS